MTSEIQSEQRFQGRPENTGVHPQVAGVLAESVV